MANIEVTYGHHIQQGWNDIVSKLESPELLGAEGALEEPSEITDQDLFCLHVADAIAFMRSPLARMVIVGAATAIYIGFGHRDQLVPFVSDAMCIPTATVEHYLDRLNGTDPSRHRWVLAEDGFYDLLTEISPLKAV